MGGKIPLVKLALKIKEIPPFPQVAIEVMKIADDPKSEATDLAETIIKDQGLTSKLLKLANSAFFGFSRRVTTVTEAVVITGFKTVKSLIVTIIAKSVLERPLKGYMLEKEMLWKHSLATAIASRMIAQKMKYKDPEEAYIAGLLADIGKVVLSEFLTETYHEILEKVENEGKTFLEAEKEILGFDHAELGAKIAEKWNLPEPLQEAIRYHHEPEKTSKILPYIVHLGNAISMMLGVGLGVDGLYYRISDRTLSILGLEESDIEEIMNDTDRHLAEVSAFV